MSRSVTARDTLRRLLEQHPHAMVSALTDDGRPQPVPAGVQLGAGHVPVLTAGIAGYLPADRPGVLAAFDAALSTGSGQVGARLVNDPQTTLHVHLVDARADLGVLLSVIVPQATGPRPAATPAVPVIPPRVARLTKSATGMLLDVDDAALQILGWRREEVVGRRSLELIHPDDQALAIESWLQTVEDPSVQARVRLRHRARDGSWTWFETYHVNLLASDSPRLVTEMVDVSAEMAAQQALEAREQLLQQLTQTLPVGVFQLGSDGGLVWGNGRLFELLRLPVASTAPDLLRAVLATDRPQVRSAMERIRSGAPEQAVDVRLSPPSAGTVCQISLRPLTSGSDGVVGIVGCVHDITGSVAARRELERQAAVDGLTGCLSRPALLAALDAALARGRDLATGTAAVYVDLDLFKQVNDQLGHAAGDELLRRTAHLLQRSGARGARVGRLGGDEFLVVCPDVESEAVAVAVGERIAALLRRRLSLAGRSVTASASVGLAWSSDSREDAADLLARADRAMYVVKRATRVAAAHSGR